MTRETAELLMEILSKVTLNVGAPDFEESAIRVLAAKRELEQILIQET